MKKSLLLFVLTLLPIAASAQCNVVINDIWYMLSDDERTAQVYNLDYLWSPVKTYTGDIVIPPTVEYQGITYTVTSLGHWAFWDSEITSISIPNTVKHIENDAFQGCNKLTTLTIPDGVEFLGDLSCDKLETLNLPNSLEHCGHIYSSSMKTLLLPDNLKYFGGCTCKKLRSLTIPNGVEYLGNLEGDNLTTITFGNGIKETSFDALYNCAWYKNLSDGVVYIGDLLYGYKGEMPANTSIKIKEGTKTINSRAFFDKAHNGLIAVNPTDYSNLKSVKIPSSVTSIGQSAFAGCTNLATITIPSTISRVGSGAFWGTAWYNNRPDGVVYVGSVLYSYKGSMPDNTSIIINDGTTSIADGAFGECFSLNSITIPQSVIHIGNNAFQGCDEITSITLPDKLTSIGDCCFQNCSSLNSIVIPSSVKSIGEQAFYNCSSLTSVTISDGVESIGNSAFSYSGLTSVTIPRSVKSISQDPFSDCTTIINITDLAAWCNISFGFSSILYNRKLSVNGVIVTDLVIPSGVTTIKSSAFYGCSSLTSVTIPNSVTWIGSYVFAECPGLNSVTIGKNVDRISNYTFGGCSNLNKISVYSKTPPVAFWSYDNSNYVYGNAFDGSLIGTTALYVPGSALSKYQTTDPWKMFGSIQKVAGDVNGDGECDMKDVIEIRNYLMGTPSSSFDINAADINGDGTVNVIDIVFLLNLI